MDPFKIPNTARKSANVTRIRCKLVIIRMQAVLHRLLLSIGKRISPLHGPVELSMYFPLL